MESMSDTENEMSPSRIGDGGKYLSGTCTWEEDGPAMDLEKLDVKSFNDALRRSSQAHAQQFEKSSGYLPTARNSISMSDDDILQKINVSKILGDDDAESGDITFDMLIPTDKVGLVIGKGGKNIKALQEKSGARMNVIQHSNTYDEYDKTLRMVGPPDLVQHARYLVYELINRTPDQNASPKYSTNSNEGYRQSSVTPVASNLSTIRYPVPKISVGLIIGRGGETIKKIRTETGAKVQFDPVNNNLEDLDEQVATVTGKPDQIRAACQMIQELVRTALKGFRQKSNSKSFHEDATLKQYSQSDAKHKITTNSRPIIKKHISVPADKAYIFEVQPHLLEDISSQTGVHCCIDQGDVGMTCDASETVFILKGHPRQVDVATELIMKKVRSGQGQLPAFKNNKSYIRVQEPTRNTEQKNTEWGQGDPGAPWSMQNPTSSRSQESGKSTYSFSHSQWLEYFQPERQQAQAHEWEQKVKAEQDSSIGKPSPVSTAESSPVSSSPKTPTDEEPIEPQLSNLEPISEQWSESAPDSPENMKSGVKIEESTVSDTSVPPEESNPSTSATEYNPPPFPFPPPGLPQFGPSTRVVTLYYDINSNSVVVLNQWNYA